jgi:hypothetical protein
MTIIDFILNLVGLLLWLSWRSMSLDPLVKTSAASLTGALRRAEPRSRRRWHFLAGLAGLLVIRAWFYWEVGSTVNWVPHLRFGAISVFFRSDIPGRVMLFSILSFAITLAIFYLWLLFISLVNGRKAESEPMQRMIQLHLGWVDRWPWPIKLALPLVVAGAAWMALDPLLSELRLIQPPLSGTHRVEEAAVIGLGAYLNLRFLIGGLLILWLLTTYVYLGNNAFWSFVSLTGRNALSPLRWAPLRIGKVDLRPVAEIFLVFLAAEFAQRGLTALYSRLPL